MSIWVGLGTSRYLIKHYFWVCLGGCFWKILAFEMVALVKRMVLRNVGGHQSICWGPKQYSCLENPLDRGAWWAAVHWVEKKQTQILSDFTFRFHFHALEKEMATHSSVLAWRIPGMAEPSGLPSMGSHRVGHDWSDLAAAAANRTKTQRKVGLPSPNLRGDSLLLSGFLVLTPSDYIARFPGSPTCRQ